VSTGALFAMTRVKQEGGMVRNRSVVPGLVVLGAFALITDSVVIGYVTAAALLLTVLTLLVKRASGGDSHVRIEPFALRRIDDEDDREAA
jgi:hypothetical protein